MAPLIFRRVPKGDTYTLEEFQFAYGLSDTDAARLYRISGPLRVDLDALMQAKAEKLPSQRVSRITHRHAPSHTERLHFAEDSATDYASHRGSDMKRSDLLIALKRSNADCTRGVSPVETLLLLRQLFAALEERPPRGETARPN